MSYEVLVFENLEYDDGYGVKGGELLVEVQGKYEDGRFDAYGPGGSLQTYGQFGLTDFALLGATFKKIGNNGVELGEEHFTNVQELRDEFHVTEENILEKLREVSE